MKRECNIVRDLLPLYIENMVSAESREFVEAHLSKCPECNAFYFEMTEGGEEKIGDSEAQNKILPLQIVKKKLIKRIVISVISIILSIAVLIGAGTAVYEYIDKQNKTAEIDYGESQWYSLDDRKAVVDMIFREFINPMDFGFDFKSVRFAGDAECLNAWKECNENPNRVSKIDDYRDIMVIYVSMKTPAWSKNKAFLPNIYYEDIKFIVEKDKDHDEYWRGWRMTLVSIPSPYPEATSAAE